MIIRVGDYISFNGSPDGIPANSGTVRDLYGYSEIDTTTMPDYCITVDIGDGTGSTWSLNVSNINSGGSQNVNVITNIDSYAIGEAVSNGIINSGLGQVNLMTDNSAMHDIANKLQQLLDKDKPKPKVPVVIPEVENKLLIL